MIGATLNRVTSSEIHLVCASSNCNLRNLFLQCVVRLFYRCLPLTNSYHYFLKFVRVFYQHQIFRLKNRLEFIFLAGDCLWLVYFWIIRFASESCMGNQIFRHERTFMMDCYCYQFSCILHFPNYSVLLVDDHFDGDRYRFLQHEILDFFCFQLDTKLLRLGNLSRQHCMLCYLNCCFWILKHQGPCFLTTFQLY